MFLPTNIKQCSNAGISIWNSVTAYVNTKALLIFVRLEPNRTSNLSEWSKIRTQNHLVRKQKFNHLAKLASLAKRLSFRLWTKWFQLQILLQSLKLRYHASFEQNVPWHSGKYIEYRFTLKGVRDMIRKYS